MSISPTFAGRSDVAKRVHMEHDTEPVRNETQEQRRRYNRHRGTEPTTDHVIVKIHNTGIVISDEDRPFIFERFCRADKARSRGAGGAGLGLSIVKLIADAHRASIHVTSKPGTGSAFEFRMAHQAGASSWVPRDLATAGEPWDTESMEWLA